MERPKGTHLIPTGKHYLNLATWLSHCRQYISYRKEEWELKSSLAFHEHTKYLESRRTESQSGSSERKWKGSKNNLGGFSFSLNTYLVHVEAPGRVYWDFPAFWNSQLLREHSWEMKDRSQNPESNGSIRQWPSAWEVNISLERMSRQTLASLSEVSAFPDGLQKNPVSYNITMLGRLPKRSPVSQPEKTFFCVLCTKEDWITAMNFKGAGNLV